MYIKPIEINGYKLRSKYLPRESKYRIQKRADKTGKRFGRLLIIECLGVIGSTYRLWGCICDCGKKVAINSRELDRGHTRSCGCLRDETLKINIIKNAGANKKNYGEARFNDLYLSYKRRAKKSNLEFSLSKEDFRELTKGNCFYCGIEPNQIINAGNNINGEYIYNGIDRINNNLGYTRDNCRSCCKYCNMAKGSMNEDEFISWINKIYEHWLSSKARGARFEFGESG